MFDEEVVQMIGEYGYVTTLNFLVYGQLELKDADMLSVGLIPKMMLICEEQAPFILLVNYIDEDNARMMGSYQGTKVSFIFGGQVPHPEELSKHIGEGIDFLRFKFDYLGVGKWEHGV